MKSITQFLTESSNNLTWKTCKKGDNIYYKDVVSKNQPIKSAKILRTTEDSYNHLYISWDNSDCDDRRLSGNIGLMKKLQDSDTYIYNDDYTHKPVYIFTLNKENLKQYD